MWLNLRNLLDYVQVGANVEVKLPDKKDLVEGSIVKIQDCSQYTVGKGCFLKLYTFLKLVSN